jgi:hypothetical protein
MAHPASRCALTRRARSCGSPRATARVSAGASRPRSASGATRPPCWPGGPVTIGSEAAASRARVRPAPPASGDAERIWSAALSDPHHERQGDARRGGGRGQRQDPRRGQRSDVMKLKGPSTQLMDLQGQDAGARLRRRPRPRRRRRPAGAVGQPAGPARRQGARHRLAAADAARLGPGTPPPSRKTRSSSASATTTPSSRSCAIRPRKSWTRSRRTSRS